MDHHSIISGSQALSKAMRSRWRTGGPRASMSADQGLENAFANPSPRRVRVRSLSEDHKITPMPKMTGCPKCGSHKIAGWKPTDFESAKCEECGKIYEPTVAENQSREGQRFLHVDDLLDSFNQGWKESGIRDKNDYIKQEFVNQEKEYVRKTGTMDAHSRKVIFGRVHEIMSVVMTRTLKEDVSDANGTVEYDPNSSEPRYLQMAKAKLANRRDLKCRDCGFTGIPASVDGNCPECGGLMNEPENQVTSAAQTASQIRDAIRQQVAGMQQGLKAESVHGTVPHRSHDIHLSELITQYGYKANGNRYTLDEDPSSFLLVDSHEKWIHKHHGVRHEGHGYKSLASHLSRYGNHRSER